MIEGKWNRRQFPRAAGVGAGVLFFGGRLDAAIVDEVVHRTPGYVSWQGEEWLACCGDACEFLVPEPATLLLLGLGSLVAIRKRR